MAVIAAIVFGVIFLVIGAWLLHVASNGRTFTIKLIEGTIAAIFLILAVLFLAGGAGVKNKVNATVTPVVTSPPGYLPAAASASAPPSMAAPQMSQIKA